MIAKSLSNLLRVTALLGLAGWAAITSARAASLEPASVVSFDTYSVEVVGYNTANPAANIYLIAPTLMPTFGSFASIPGAALGGQTLTINSVEYVNNGFVTDFISLNVPTNFVPAGTRDNAGNTLNAIQFSIGNYLGGTNTLDFNAPLSAYSVTGTVSFNFFGQPTAGVVPMTTTLTNNNQSLTTFGVVTATPSTADISNNQVNAFSIIITYPVPEPSTNAAVALGTAGVLLVVTRRRRRA